MTESISYPKFKRYIFCWNSLISAANSRFNGKFALWVYPDLLFNYGTPLLNTYFYTLRLIQEEDGHAAKPR